MKTKADKITKIIADFSTKKYSSISNFYQAGTTCTKTIAALSSDYNEAIINTAYNLLEQLKTVDPENDDTEYLFQILIEALQIKQVDHALTLIHTALQNEYAEDDTIYINLLLSYPKETLIPLFLKILPSLESWDEDGGEPQEIIINKLTLWDVKLPHKIIVTAIEDEAYKVRAAIVQYIRRYDLKAYTSHLARLSTVEDDPRLLQQINQLLSQWDIV